MGTNPFKQFGVMIDCSRNAVVKVGQIKKLIDYISAFGYNQLMLYTEDTYEIDGEPLFGYMRGRFSQEELKEVDDYAFKKGVELIPCIQTLAHLTQIFRHAPYAQLHDIDDCIMMEADKTYELIEKMIATCAKCFRSKRIHLGMDEAINLGLGIYHIKKGYKPKAELLFDHIMKVYDMAKKYGYTEPKVWYDQFAWGTYGPDFYIADTDTPVRNGEFADNLPKDLKIVYWDYNEWGFQGNTYDYHIPFYKDINGNLSFAGSVYKCSGMLALNKRSISEARISIDTCKKHGLDDYLVTCWSDNGSEASVFSTLPGLYAIAKIARDEEIDKAEFEQIVGVKYDDFLLLDKVNAPGNAEHGYRQIAPIYLYNDIFQNVADGLVYDGLNEFYAERAEELKRVQGGEFQYLFDGAVKLCDILSVKAELGKKIRQAYSENKNEQLACLLQEIQVVLDKLEDYEKTYRKQWNYENKTFGYYYISLKFGTLKERLCYCKETLEDYLENRISKIEELEEEVIYGYTDINHDRIGFNHLLGHGYC